jgi:hypothetical protein
MNADIVIDARDLEPPEPLVRTMEALDQLGEAEKAAGTPAARTLPAVQGARTQRFHLARPSAKPTARWKS